MKKLKLKLNDLEVTSFAAQHEQKGTGTVNGLQSTTEDLQSNLLMHGCLASYDRTECAQQCTLGGGCHPSQYCSYIGPGMPNNTCYEGCVTDNYAAC